MKVYIAGRYSRRDEFRLYRNVLQAAGIEVTSRWLNEDGDLNTKMGDDTAEFYVETAKVDLEDIEAADTLLFFAEDPLVGIPRGGRHVEFGFALGRGKGIGVIGPRENVFHYDNGCQVRHFDNVGAFVDEVTYMESFKKYLRESFPIGVTN